MTDPNDKLTRAYRDLAREEPPASLDAAILARAREGVGARQKPSWMVPVSIAAVLMLGIGVTLRMQTEEPGIETSVPAPSNVPETHSPSPAAQPATTLPEASEPPAAESKPAAAEAPPPKVEKKAKDRVDSMRRQENVAPASQAAPAPSTTTPTFTPPPPAAPPAPPAPAARTAPAPATMAAPPSAAAGAAANAPAPGAARSAQDTLQAAPQRTKREAESDANAMRDLKKSIAAESDPERELERIAQLRADNKHAEADQALEAFRKRYPDYRIPDAMWQRVKPR
jgi:hypothetical protein